MGNPQFKPIQARIWNSNRWHERTSVQRRTTLRDEGGTASDVILEDLSLTGFRMSSTDTVVPGQSILVGLEGVGVRAAKVVWSKDDAAGCEFDNPISRSEMDATMNASVVIANAFAFTKAPAEEDAPELAPQPGLSRRRRCAIILLAATACWGTFIALGMMIRMLVRLF